MLRLHLGLMLLVLAWASPAAARHGEFLLDARRATPGVRLVLVELPTGTTHATAYRLRAVGVPPGLTFAIWTKDFGQDFREIVSGFRLNETGPLVAIDESRRPRRLDDVILRPGPIPPGAGWEVALVSSDHTVLAFAKVFPRPIIARDGACIVSLELVSRRGDRFVASADGFTAGEDVLIELWHAKGHTQRRQRASAEGRLAPHLISHTSDTGHRARYAVRGRSCAVILEYEWGDPAVTRR